MKIAIFGRSYDNSFQNDMKVLLTYLEFKKVKVYVYDKLVDCMNGQVNIPNKTYRTFIHHTEITPDFNFFISIGGDGTFLEAVRFVRHKNIPLVGINTGRLGFLANISRNEIEQSIDCLLSGKFKTEYRSLIEFETANNPFSEFPYALNEVTIQKHGASLINIHTTINGQHVNNYWTDGLIISTPTGSTAYSMSAGGPILSPDCNNIILSPIASHTLSVRPIVVPGNFVISLQVKARSNIFLATIDSLNAQFNTGNEIILKPATFKIATAVIEGHSFFATLRQKLMWGADFRN